MNLVVKSEQTHFPIEVSFLGSFARLKQNNKPELENVFLSWNIQVLLIMGVKIDRYIEIFATASP